jgi:hypothetical protein
MEGWDQSKFDETLEEYAKYSKRTHAQIVNTKAYYVARKALWFTPKADSYKMKQQLGGLVTVSRVNRKGRTVRRRQLQLVNSTRQGLESAPLAALILNTRMGKKGIKGLYGSKMERAIKELLSSRYRSVAFIKSGWLGSIRALAPLVKDKSAAAPADPSAKQVGRPKGEATPAADGENPTATIVNLASARRDEKGALIQFGQGPLMQALQDEDASMHEYIERKIAEDAERFNAQQK